MSDSPDHLVKSYDNDLRRLRDMLTEMGGIVESQVALAAEAIMNRDSAAATRAVEEDPKVDALEREVEQFVIRMLALRQPMASDLRRVVAALKITGDLERIGDYAANISKRTIALSHSQIIKPLAGVVRMGKVAQQILKEVLDAISRRDADTAKIAWGRDSEVDEMYTSVFRELLTYMMEDPRNITPCTHLLFMAKNIERIGDHATNIAETVYYMVTGEAMRERRPKRDTTSFTDPDELNRPGERGGA
jgi:phosphate transport system protein